MQYRKEIEGLRALAVVPVILFHAGFQWCSGGFVGVDVFFVISGYLITSIILSKLDAGQFSLLDFYERRARRILPALFFMMAVCWLLGWYWLPPQDMSEFSASSMAVSLFVSNIFFWMQSGYFDTAAALKPLLHTWSLGVEEQFYLLFPLLLVLTKKIDIRRVLYFLAFLSFSSLAFTQWATFAQPEAAFYLLPSRAWELSLGVFVAYGMRGRRDLTMAPWLRELVGAMGVVMIVFAMSTFDYQTAFPGVAALLPTIGTALIILCVDANSVIGACLGNRVFAGVGTISYSAYLWHQPVLVFIRNRLSNRPEIPVLMWAIALTFLLAYLSWRFIEAPFRQKRPFFSKSFVFAFAAVGSVFFLGLGMAGVVTQGFPERPSALVYQHAAAKNHERKACDAPALTTGEHLGYCVRPKHGLANAVVIGDSHAEDKLFGFESNVTELNWSLMGSESCPPFIGINVDSLRPKGCLKKFEKIISWIAHSNDIKTVVLSFYGEYMLTTSYSADHLENHLGPENAVITGVGQPNLDRSELFYYGLSFTVDTLQSSGKKVIVLVDVPELPFFPADCIRGRENCIISRTEVLQRQGELRKIMAKLAATHPDVGIFDPLDLFCTGQICSYKNGKTIMYRDSHHLSRDGSNLYGKEFYRWLSEREVPLNEHPVAPR